MTNICVKCGRTKIPDECICELMPKKALPPQAATLVANLKQQIAEFDRLELSVSDKMRVAAEVQDAVDFLRFRAGLDKECFNCRQQNAPDAKKCISCGETIICEACSAKGLAWRCSHASGFKIREAIRMARVEAAQRKEAVEPKEEREPPREKRRFTLE